MSGSAYETVRNPALPWGYWLRTDVGDPAGTMLIDEEGQRFASVREAYWCGHLGMPGNDGGSIDSRIEMLHGVLTAIGRRGSTSVEIALDLFDGDRVFQQFFFDWAYSVGLLNPTARSWNASLSAEGRAVLLMLVATRPHELWRLPVGAPTVAALTVPYPSNADREQWLVDTETSAATLPFRFKREVIHGISSIVLIGDALGEVMPIGRTLWSTSFPNAEIRDRLFHWLCVRLDRWIIWGSATYKHGAAYLTQHLLMLVLGSTIGNSADDHTKLTLTVQPPQ